ncbi:MAG: alpha/beta fold hydrolase [Leptospiraceae bacterium]|nr:alpha/beta fold hydrolase [Leptospiraceae bacterium]
MSLDPRIKSKYISVEGISIHYLESGESEDVLLLFHGWPTSAYLWRNILPELGKKKRVIAIDLPGFGKSDKPLDASYNFPFYSKIITAFLKKLEINHLQIGVHDLGGPIGLFWVCQNMNRVDKLIIFNTLVYSDFSLAVAAFVTACSLPLVSDFLASEIGLEIAMRIGVSNPFHLSKEVIKAYQEPFQKLEARKALIKAGKGLDGKGFVFIEKKILSFNKPIRIIYGAEDRILPEIQNTVSKLKKDLSHAESYMLENCGHFLQEEKSTEIVKLLIDWI